MAWDEQRGVRHRARLCGYQPLLLGWCLLTGCVRDWDIAAREETLDGSAATDVASEDGSAPEDTQDGSTSGEPDVDDPEPDGDSATPDDFMLHDAALPHEPDASGPADAVVAMPDAADTSAEPGFCAMQPAGFCADFEEGALEKFSWQELTPTGSATLEVVDGGVAPGRRALKSTVGGSAEEAARVALWLEDGEPSWVRAAFDFLPQFNLPARGGQVFWFKLSEQTGSFFPGVGFSSDQAGGTLMIHKFDGAAESYEAYGMQPLPAGWVHVDVMITFGMSGSVTVRFNGALAATYTGPLHVPDVNQTYLQLGVYVQQALAPTALYDNLVVEHAL